MTMYRTGRSGIAQPRCHAAEDMPQCESQRADWRPRLLSVQAVAAELGVCEKTVRRLIASRTLPAHRVGRCVRVSEGDLETYRRLNRSAGW